METNSSGEEVIVKMRKPYTITKQRERWTEEEHNRFLEAVKLYGRAWQRIEEHIGTKTAVQIRSHAQKFFTKLEKEAQMKGVPLGQAHDIEIPPPRPKRKPCSPYPRKTGAGSLGSLGEAMDDKQSKFPSTSATQKVLAMESNEHLRTTSTTKIVWRKEASEDASFSEVLNLSQEAPSASISSASKACSTACTFREFVPMMKDKNEKTTTDRSSVSFEVKEPNKNGMSYFDGDPEELQGINFQAKPTQVRNIDVSNKTDKEYLSVENNQKADHNSTTTMINQVRAHTNPNPSTVPATQNVLSFSEGSSVHQSFSAHPTFNLIYRHQDPCTSFDNISSTFSNLIVATLSQNPSVHAAANLAASFWPSLDVYSPINSNSKVQDGELPARHMNPAPSLTTIAAATVAAAAAWWATQGILPLFPPPIHPGFAFASVPAATIPIMDICQSSKDFKDGVNNTSLNPAQEVNPDQSEAQRAAHPTSTQLIASSSSDSGESERGQVLHFMELKASKPSKPSPSPDTEFRDADKVRNKKLDRSSCGSNTPSSSEVETDAMQGQHIQSNQETEQLGFNYSPSGENNSRRCRSNGCMNESWKAVSEEGRLAFQALFSRDILPQSFSPPSATDATVMIGKDIEATSFQFDLGKKACVATYLYDVQDFPKENMRSNVDSGYGSLVNEIGHGKQKVRRTGFKPYKRCTVEVENQASAGEESSSKRMRLEGDAST